MNDVNRLLRYMAALFAGTFAFVFSVSMLHLLAGWLIPGADFNAAMPASPEEWKVFIDAMPLPAKLSVFVAHWGGTTVGAAVAVLLAGRQHAWPGWAMGVLGLVGGILNNGEVPAPMWMQAVDLVGYLPLAAWISWRLKRVPDAA